MITNLNFDVKDIDAVAWVKRARAESELIQTNDKDKARDMETDIFPKTFRGHGAEMIAMKYLGHTDNPADWQDTFDVDKVNTEHKVSVSPKYLKRTLQAYEDDLNDTTTEWHIKRANNMARRVYGWINMYRNDEAYQNRFKDPLSAFSSIYNFYGVWEWVEGDNKLLYMSPKMWYNILNERGYKL